MASREVERALKKERLLQQSRVLRDDWAHHARGVEPAFAAVDAVNAGWQWLRANPLVPVVVVTAVIVVRPMLLWRLGQGVWAGWKVWRRWQHLIVPPADSSEEFR